MWPPNRSPNQSFASAVAPVQQTHQPRSLGRRKLAQSSRSFHADLCSTRVYCTCDDTHPCGCEDTLHGSCWSKGYILDCYPGFKN
jgi:hypothetical protein